MCLINGAGFSLACSLWVLVFGFFLLPVVVFLLITEGRFLARRKINFGGRKSATSFKLVNNYTND
jgi:hypothetical protein